MSTDQLLHNALSDMADAADKIHPNGGDHIRKLADEKYPQHVLLTKETCNFFHAPTVQCPVCEGGLAVCGKCGRYETELDDYPTCTPINKPPAPHVHDFKRVPDSERNDTLRFCATMFRCDECGESYTC